MYTRTYVHVYTYMYMYMYASVTIRDDMRTHSWAGRIRHAQTWCKAHCACVFLVNTHLYLCFTHFVKYMCICRYKHACIQPYYMYTWKTFIYPWKRVYCTLKAIITEKVKRTSSNSNVQKTIAMKAKQLSSKQHMSSTPIRHISSCFTTQHATVGLQAVTALFRRPKNT